MAILLIATAMAVPAFVGRTREVRDCATQNHRGHQTGRARRQWRAGITYRFNISPQDRTLLADR